ncbi:ADP-ribosylglycohydrolase family protein [Rhodoferax sp.]|uniref:ADP-ribosylglycohydrolase family protein n=1 Tax=Rhodoferax sp. TaxID=50421 RepID=UPI003A0FD5A6
MRLSTSRAINGAGFFDVESFAKIELPVWLNYALGAGRGSKAAAANLALRDSSWSLNFFSSASVKYWDGGGNGAAMRIQPHVWQNHDAPRHAFVSDVIRNSVCTHGHPRADWCNCPLRLALRDYAKRRSHSPF